MAKEVDSFFLSKPPLVLLANEVPVELNLNQAYVLQRHTAELIRDQETHLAIARKERVESDEKYAEALKRNNEARAQCREKKFNYETLLDKLDCLLERSRNLCKMDDVTNKHLENLKKQLHEAKRSCFGLQSLNIFYDDCEEMGTKLTEEYFENLLVKRKENLKSLQVRLNEELKEKEEELQREIAASKEKEKMYMEEMVKQNIPIIELPASNECNVDSNLGLEYEFDDVDLWADRVQVPADEV